MRDDLTDALNPRGRKANSDLQDNKKHAGRDDYVKSDMHRNLIKERSKANRVDHMTSLGPHRVAEVLNEALTLEGCDVHGQRRKD